MVGTDGWRFAYVICQTGVSFSLTSYLANTGQQRRKARRHRLGALLRRQGYWWGCGKKCCRCSPQLGDCAYSSWRGGRRWPTAGVSISSVRHDATPFRAKSTRRAMGAQTVLSGRCGRSVASRSVKAAHGSAEFAFALGRAAVMVPKGTEPASLVCAARPPERKLLDTQRPFPLCDPEALEHGNLGQVQ
jgi:hypothetical protein